MGGASLGRCSSVPHTLPSYCFYKRPHTYLAASLPLTNAKAEVRPLMFIEFSLPIVTEALKIFTKLPD